MRVTYFHRKARPNANFSIEQVFENVRRDLAGKIDARVCVAPCYSNGVLRRFWIAWRARQHQGDINHVTGDTNFTALLLDGPRTVLTNHDCGYMTRTRGWKRWWLKKLWLDWPVSRVAAVTTVSGQIKGEIVQFTGCSPDKVHVIHNAASPAFSPSPLAFESERPRILHVGTAPNKNLPRLIAAIVGWPCVLVIVGRLSSADLVLLRDSRIDFENYVDLTTSGLVAQYHASDVVAFASLYEGFGVPILEAQAVGRPLLTSDRSPMNEVAGAGACLVDPSDVPAIRDALQRIASDGEYRQRLVAAGFENVKRFSPKEIAEQYYQLYAAVLETGAPTTNDFTTAA